MGDGWCCHPPPSSHTGCCESSGSKYWLHNIFFESLPDFCTRGLCFHMTFFVLMVKFSIRFLPGNHKWELHFGVWSFSWEQNPALVQAKVYVRRKFWFSSQWKNPVHATDICTAVDTLALMSHSMWPRTTDREQVPPPSKAYRYPVGRTGHLTNYLRQQRYFPNNVQVGCVSKLGSRLRWLPCPHHKQAANNSPNESKLLAEKEFFNSPPFFFFSKRK